MAKLVLVFPEGTHPARPIERGSRLVDGPRQAPAVLTLRAVKSRCWIALSHLYLSIGARGAREQPDQPYPAKTLAYALDFSAASTVSLCCRKIFDHPAKEMNGMRVVQLTPEEADGVAVYWSKNAGRSEAEAHATLGLLMAILKPLCKTKQQLKESSFLLARRVGYLKRHADAEAAHLGLEYYEFDTRDAAHVVAALAIIGSLIEEFDGPSPSLDQFDEAAYVAAQSVFPSLACGRLFQWKSICAFIEDYRKISPSDAAHHISEFLPFELQWPSSLRT